MEEARLNLEKSRLKSPERYNSNSATGSFIHNLTETISNQINYQSNSSTMTSRKGTRAVVYFLIAAITFVACDKDDDEKHRTSN